MKFKQTLKDIIIAGEKRKKMRNTPVDAQPVGINLSDIEDDDEIIELMIKASQRAWSVSGDETVFWGAGAIYENIPAGLYKCSWTDNIGHNLRKILISVDELIELPDSESQMVINQIKKFWTLKKEFNKRGFLHKRGILMYGEPGSGKTATIQQLIKLIIAENGVALYADRPDFLANCLQMIRRIEKERPLIVIIEDFETLIEEKYRENEWLAILDGEAQVDNIVFIATTNYIERLDKRIVDRPSRFDVLVPVLMPTAESRALFLKTKEPSLTIEELKEWVPRTKGYSIAHLKELLISVKCYGHNLEETIKRLDKMRDRKEHSSNLEKARSGARGGIGYTSSSDRSIDKREQIDWTKWEIKPAKKAVGQTKTKTKN